MKGKVSSTQSFTHKLLKAVALSGTIVIVASNPYFGLYLFKGIQKELKRRKWRQFYNTLHQLKRQKRLDIFHNNDGTYKVELTDLGKKVVHQYDLNSLNIPKQEKWDGRWRFFSFDIPVHKKEARAALLGKLKELGLILVQRSLWAHPFECRKELMIIAKAFEVESHVLYIAAQEVSGGEWLRVKFNKQNQTMLI
ncbi:MAG: hypothetical protein Q7S32_02180 [bacterium]|nr:hypothetical protein [bacterium]